MNPHEALQLAHAEANGKIGHLLAPQRRAAKKLGFKAFIRVEPEVVLANGEQVYARCVQIKLVPNSPRATLACKRDGVLHSIQAEDRYVELEDAEACMVDVFDCAIEAAKQALA